MLTLVFSITLTVYSQQKEVKENIIDTRMQYCLDSKENQSSIAMMDCTRSARDS